MKTMTKRMRIATRVRFESKVRSTRERSASARENESCEDVGGDVGRAFKETLSLQELNLTNCGAVGGSVRVFQKEHGSKLKDLRVARLGGTKVYDGPPRVPNTPNTTGGGAITRSKKCAPLFRDGGASGENERETGRERGRGCIRVNKKPRDRGDLDWG